MPDPLTIRSLFREYEVTFADDQTEVLAELAAAGRYVIADPAVLGRFGDHSLPGDRLLLLAPSEECKTLDQVQLLIQWLAEARFRRGEILVALGGGVIQDVTAFTASIMYRGVDWIFIPTTLLAQADSCIGSKTSINAGHVKNVVGNFYPPRRVVIYPGFLESLPIEEVRSGIGEILHFFIYADSPLLEPLMNEYEDLLADPERLQPYIAESLRIKKGVIELDEFDRGERNKFNYGHTFGHALEAITDFAVRHGQAVTVGMDLANYVSHHLGLLTPEDDRRLHRLLRPNFPTLPLEDLDLDAYMALLARDKKNVDGDLTCILCQGPGRLIKRKIPLDADTRAVVARYFKGALHRG